MVLVDTNILIAAARPDDDDHEVAAELMATTPGPLLVAPTVIAEVCYMLATWGAPGSEVAFLRSFREDWLQLADLTSTDLARMADLTERYTNLGLGGTDASLVAIAERLGITDIATLDRRHFTVVRPSHVDAFTLLP